MARTSRKSVESTYFHVMTQGIGKEKIFKKKSMKEKYKSLLIEKSKQNNVTVIAYCIMENHVHCLIKIEKNEDLSKMMLQINSGYGKFYNKSINRVGYVFRDRYRAEPIHNINHLHNCIRYIHENPVKANIVKSCGEYFYSSYNDYISYKMDKNIIIEIFGENSNYIDNLSGNYEDYSFIETNNEFGLGKIEDFNKICKEYSNVNYNDEINVYNISKELKKRSNATNKQIMNFMKLKKTRYYSIMKKQKR